MSARDLRALLNDLESRGDVHHIVATVNADEIAVIAARARQRVLLFDNVQGSPFSVVCNLWNDEARFVAALGLKSLDDLRVKLGRLLDLNIPRGAVGVSSRIGDWIDVARSVGMFPSGGNRHTPVQEIKITDAPDITRLPAFHSCADETYPSLTSALLITQVGSDQSQMRLTRVAVIDEHTLGVPRGDVPPSSAPIAAAVVLGADPTLTWSAGVPLPIGLDRALLAAWLRGKPSAFTRGITQPVEVPSEAEVAIEGMIDTSVTIPITWGEHDGWMHDDLLVPLRVTAMTHREHALIPMSMPRRSDAEWARRATERLFIPIIRVILDDIMDLHQVSDDVVLVRLKDDTPGVAERIIYGLWGILPMCKVVVTVDQNIDVFDLNTVSAIVTARWDIDAVLYGRGRIGFDASTRLNGALRAVPQANEDVLVRFQTLLDQRFAVPTRVAAVFSSAIEHHITEHWDEYGLELPV